MVDDQERACGGGNAFGSDGMAVVALARQRVGGG